MALLDYFKVSRGFSRTVYLTYALRFQGLMTSYMSFLLTPFTEVLNSHTKSITSEDLWLVVIQTITRSLAHDEGGQSPSTLIHPLIL